MSYSLSNISSRGLQCLAWVSASALVPSNAKHLLLLAELEAYGRGLSDRPQILALNKIDAVEPELLGEIVARLHKISETEPFLISTDTRAGLESLTQAVWQALDEFSELS